MTNKYKYFVANWKMFGDLNTVNSINKVVKLSKLRKFKKTKIIYCPPYTLLNSFVEKLRNTKIEVGGQNCHYESRSGPFTGSISSQMIKNIGCNYVIIGHSENRMEGETNKIINKKIIATSKINLKILFCFGESLEEMKSKKTKKVISNQIKSGLRKIKNINNIIFSYEPVWSIGTGVVLNNQNLKNNILFIKSLLKKKYKLNNPKVLYGGSVKPTNINELRKIKEIDGFLIGGASQNPNKFIDIIKKTFI